MSRPSGDERSAKSRQCSAQRRQRATQQRADDRRARRASAAVDDIKIVKGEPTEEELAALVAVLGAAAGGPSEPGPQELNLWGHPVDKLRYAVFSWQRVTLLERTYMRR